MIYLYNQIIKQTLHENGTIYCKKRRTLFKKLATFNIFGVNVVAHNETQTYTYLNEITYVRKCKRD